MMNMIIIVIILIIIKDRDNEFTELNNDCKDNQDQYIAS